VSFETACCAPAALVGWGGKTALLGRQTALRFASMEISPGRKRFLWVLLGLVVLNAVIFIWDRLRPSREDTS
jgi:hypothetical protein